MVQSMPLPVRAEGLGMCIPPTIHTAFMGRNVANGAAEHLDPRDAWVGTLPTWIRTGVVVGHTSNVHRNFPLTKWNLCSRRRPDETTFAVPSGTNNKWDPHKLVRCSACGREVKVATENQDYGGSPRGCITLDMGSFQARIRPNGAPKPGGAVSASLSVHRFL